MMKGWNDFNSLPNNKILDQSEFKAFADILNVVQMMEYVSDGVENMVGKGVVKLNL